MVSFVVCLAVAFGVGLIVRPRWRPGADVWGQTVVVAAFAGVFSSLRLLRMKISIQPSLS